MSYNLSKFYKLGKERRRLDDKLIDKEMDFEEYQELKPNIEFSRDTFAHFYFQSLAYTIGDIVQEGPIRFLADFGGFDKYSRAVITDKGVEYDARISLNPFVPLKKSE